MHSLQMVCIPSRAPTIIFRSRCGCDTHSRVIGGPCCTARARCSRDSLVAVDAVPTEVPESEKAAVLPRFKCREGPSAFNEDAEADSGVATMTAASALCTCNNRAVRSEQASNTHQALQQPYRALRL